MSKFIVDIQNNCHRQTANRIRPSEELDTHIYFHSISGEKYKKLHETYSKLPQVSITTCIVTRYYNQDLVLEVVDKGRGAEEMICTKTFQNYRIYSPDLLMDFSRNKIIPISVSKFETLKNLDHRRQSRIITISGSGFRLELESLYKETKHRVMSTEDSPEEILSYSYCFYFTEQPDTLFISKHLHLLQN